MSDVNPNEKIVIKINLKKKPNKQHSTSDLLTIPLAASETNSDVLRTPLLRLTGLSEKAMIRSVKVTPVMSELVTPSRSLR